MHCKQGPSIEEVGNRLEPLSCPSYNSGLFKMGNLSSQAPLKTIVSYQLRETTGKELFIFLTAELPRLCDIP